jgi:hypothetical protein
MLEKFIDWLFLVAYWPALWSPRFRIVGAIVFIPWVLVVSPFVLIMLMPSMVIYLLVCGGVD